MIEKYIYIPNIHFNVWKHWYYFIVPAFLFTSSSCKSSYTLQSDEYKLVKNIIDFESEDRIKDRISLKESLKLLYQQQESTKSGFNPRTWFAKDKLTIYDEDKTILTSQAMQKYLQNKKGYYQAKVSYKTLFEKNKSAIVKYIVDPGIRYHISSISYKGDSTIIKEINTLNSLRIINEGDPLDATEFDSEKYRITNGLQNKGYSNFLINYIEIEGDSSNHNHTVDVIFKIKDTPTRDAYQKYRVGNINIYTNHLNNTDTTSVEKYAFDSKMFHSVSSEFLVKPNALNRSIFLNKDSIFRKNDRLKTRRKLSRLSTYKYVSILQKPDPVHDTLINFNIFLTPQDNPWVMDFGSDIFVSTVTSIGRELIGISGNTSLQNRNLLGGSELYTVNLEGTVELDISRVDASSISFSIDHSLLLPRQIDLFGITYFMRGFGLISKERVRSFKEESTTEIRLGYTYSNIINVYTLNSLNLSWGYDYQPNQHSRYRIKQLSLNLLDTKISPAFDTIIGSQPLIRNSFVDNLSTGFLFRELTYVYQGPVDLKGRSVRMVGNIEFSGVETFLVNKLSNVITGNTNLWSLGNINFAKYFKGELEGVYNKNFNLRNTIALRSYLGLAVPYGRKDEVVPYVTQFYAGGPNSIRAWQLRELGPGGRVIDPTDPEIFYQTGELKFEFNLEYRLDLFWFFEGALFLEGGNIWTLRNDEERPGSQISSKFFDQLAIGAGWGIRADFSYFLIRFDFGYKLRNPFTEPEFGGRWLFDKESFNKYNDLLGNINIAVNYPF